MESGGKGSLATRDDEGLSALVTRLVDEAKDYGRAEMAYVQAIARERSGAAAKGSGMLAAAAVVGLSTLTTLLVGLVLTLAPYVGPLGATLIVVLVGAVAAALLARSGIARVKASFRAGGENVA